MVLKRNPDIIPDLGGGENYRVLKHGPNLLKRLCSLGERKKLQGSQTESIVVLRSW